MKKYKLKDLVVLTIQNDEKILHNKNKIICKRCWSTLKEESYLEEIFTGQRFTKETLSKLFLAEEEFSKLFPNLAKNCKDYKFSKIELFPYYNELNKIELLKNTTDEDIENYLRSKNEFDNSKIYLKKM